MARRCASLLRLCRSMSFRMGCWLNSAGFAQARFCPKKKALSWQLFAIGIQQTCHALLFLDEVLAENLEAKLDLTGRIRCQIRVLPVAYSCKGLLQTSPVTKSFVAAVQQCCLQRSQREISHLNLDFSLHLRRP